jgi:hypothetical protein
MPRNTKNDNSIALPNAKNIINPVVLDSNGLSPDEMKFCSFYIIHNFNGTKAAIEAGYSPEFARQYGTYYLKKARVQQHIKDLLEEEENKLGVSRSWKISVLKQCVEDGIDIKDYGVAINAIKELNQMQGDYAPTRTINANFNIETDPRDMQEVDEIIKKYRQEY